LQVAGGIGVAGTSYFAGGMSVAGTLTALSDLNVANTGKIDITGPDNSAALGTSSFKVFSLNRLAVVNINFANLNTSNSTFEIGIQGTTRGAFSSTGLAVTGAATISSSTAGSSGAGALVVTGGLSAGGASYFGGGVTVTGNVQVGTPSGNDYILKSGNSTATGSLIIQAGGGSALYGGSIIFYSGSHATRPGWVWVGLGSGSARKFVVSDLGLGGGNEVFSVDAIGNGTFAGTVSPQQATTAAAPAYVKGAIYFDTTLNKLRVGGATAWETITSV